MIVVYAHAIELAAPTEKYASTDDIAIAQDRDDLLYDTLLPHEFFLSSRSRELTIQPATRLGSGQ